LIVALKILGYNNIIKIMVSSRYELPLK